MDHALIENDHVADLYLQGKLAPEEVDRFEEHYLSCEECLGRLSRAERMARGFKRAAAEDALTLATVRRAGFLAALARLGRSRQAGLAVAALLLVLLVPGAWMYREFGRLGRELASTREALAERSRNAPAPAPVAAEPEDAAALNRAEAARQRLEEELARERSAKTALEQDLARARAPQANTPILSLSPERSAGTGEPTHRLTLTSGWVVLSLDLDAPEPGSYQVTLSRQGGGVVWKGTGLEPNATDSLVLSVPTSLLAPGDYVVRVEGPGQGAVPVTLSFRAVPPAS